MTISPSPQNNASLPVITGYRLLRVLAEGATSVVYLAEQESLGRQVALKVMRPDALADEVSRRRFENEIRTVGRLDHPHIVGIFHIGRTTDGLPYYSMPYLANGHLGQRDFRNDEAGVREVLRGLLSALAYAHSRGVIHRDVKAENVLFDDAGRALLADFGIALRRGYGSRVTSAGLAVGSTAYMAPEQARGEEVDPRADLYSVGVLAWEMLAGELPYQAHDALAMAVMHARDPIPRLPAHLRHWQRFMDRALAKYPLKRFHDANEMLHAVEHLPMPGRRRISPGDLVKAAGNTPRRVPGYVWIIGGLVLAALLGLGLQRMGTDPGPQAGRFFRATTAPQADTQGMPGSAMEPGTPVGDPAAPQSRAGHLIENARRQLQARRLTTPAGDNAYDTLLAALAEDPDHLELGPTAAELVAALGQQAARRLEAGDTPDTVAAMERAARLVGLVAPAADAELEQARRTLATAMEARVRNAARQFDRLGAQRAIEPAEAVGLDPGVRTRLAGLVESIPALGQVVPGDPGRMTVQRGGEDAYALTGLHISRDEYARFATASGREPALCRERASLLRMLSPRDWTSPGFDQTGSEPVVCVSWEDADAYARWLGQQNGARYRLPTAAEARAMPVRPGARAVAEWLLDCNGDCQARAVTGESWRRNGAATRSAGRGYDDVGFRLVREP